MKSVKRRQAVVGMALKCNCSEGKELLETIPIEAFVENVVRYDEDVIFL